MRKLVGIMWVPVLLVGLYSGWVLWQRHRSQTQPAVFQTVDPLAKYGSHVKIVQFYTTLDAITKGRKALLCHSVVNATVVLLDQRVVVHESMFRGPASAEYPLYSHRRRGGPQDDVGDHRSCGQALA